MIKLSLLVLTHLYTKSGNAISSHLNTRISPDKARREIPSIFCFISSIFVQFHPMEDLWP